MMQSNRLSPARRIHVHHQRDRQGCGRRHEGGVARSPRLSRDSGSSSAYGGVGLFSTIEAVESIEISLYLIGASAYARSGEEFGARLCAEAMGTEVVHRALARFAEGQLGKDVGVPNDVAFGPTLAKVRGALEGLGIGYGKFNNQPGRFYEYPGDPLARGVGTPVSHTVPA